MSFFSFIAGTSVASLNLSLLVNSVGFYQVSRAVHGPGISHVKGTGAGGSALAREVEVKACPCRLWVPFSHVSQISKLLIIPFVCVVEAVWLKRRYTTAVLASMVVVVFGVGVV